MTLDDLFPAIKQIEQQPDAVDLRAATYLRTYPSILKIGISSRRLNASQFHQLVLLAYGWMPRIARIDGAHENMSIDVLEQARHATRASSAKINLDSLTKCVRSIVGASKILHFVNPDVFPIWDSKVERFRLRAEPPFNHMSEAKHYLHYVREVHIICKDRRFKEFHRSFNAAFAKRLQRLQIKPYKLARVRAIEAAAFELAGGDYEA